jgi:hypothetical protein
MGCRTGVRFPVVPSNFSLLQSVQNGSELHPASYNMGTGAVSQRFKRPGREIQHSHLSSTKVKNAGAIFPQYTFMALYLIN